MRQMDVDWSDWDGKVKQPEHPLSRPLNKSIKTGADSASEALATGNVPIIEEAPRQPTDEEMFGHLVPSEKDLQKADDLYNNRHAAYKEWYTSKLEDEPNKGVGPFHKCMSFNDLFKSEGMSDEELEARNATGAIR